jgi:transcriptional antiterminator NusG
LIDKDKHWYVVRTNVKAEDKASANIRKAGYDVYYPRRRVEVKNKRTHTYTTRETPLMPRDVFVGYLNPIETSSRFVAAPALNASWA